MAPYLDALAAVRLGLNSPAVAEAAFPDAAGMAAGFDGYRATLAELGALDFDEQIYRGIEILVRDPDARRVAQARCRRLLVDEFQDLTPAHLLLIRLLAAPGFDCFGVGDDDQVIYGYSGATPEYLIDFPRYFPGAGQHSLEVNYRCAPEIVRAARNLLSHNERRIDKVICAPEESAPGQGRDMGRSPEHRDVALDVRTAPADELAALAVEVLTGWRESGVPLDDMAVLARVNSGLLAVQVACVESGVPCSTPLGAAVLNRTGIRTALAYLRIGADPDHIRSEDVRDTIRRPSRGIAPMVVDMLTGRRTTSITEIRRLAGRLSGRDVKKLEAYAGDLAAVAAAHGKSSAAMLRTVRLGIGLDATMDVLDASRRAADRSTHTDDLVALESVAALHQDAATFEPWLREVLTRPAAHGPAVVLSTVHRIKGKEWERVIVFGASSGLFPHRMSDDEEGERRVFHVALTRARSQAVVLADAAAPSMFVGELERPAPARRDSATGAGADPGSRSTSSGPGRDAVGRGARGRPHGRVVGETSGRAPRGRSSASRAPRVLRREGDGGVVETALREWRSAVARREGVPAYVVLNDAELVGLALRGPQSLAELAACRGMGPIRLERWGDEILAVLETIRANGPTSGVDPAEAP